jgi:hypothetical protein
MDFGRRGKIIINSRKKLIKKTVYLIVRLITATA